MSREQFLAALETAWQNSVDNEARKRAKARSPRKAPAGRTKTLAPQKRAPKKNTPKKR